MIVSAFRYDFPEEQGMGDKAFSMGRRRKKSPMKSRVHNNLGKLLYAAKVNTLVP